MVDRPLIKNLVEAVGADEEDIERLKQMRIEAGLRELRMRTLIISRGGNIHGTNPKAVAKRRKANKAARKARRR